MKLTILNGYSILRDDKTGVDVFWSELTKAIIKRNDDSDIRIAELAPGIRSLKLMAREQRNHVFSKHLLFRWLPYPLRERIPIEWITGRTGIFVVGGWMPRKIKKDTKILTVIHDLMIYRYPENYTEASYNFQDTYFKNCAQKADIIIAVSDTTKQDIVRYLGIEPDRIQIVNNGVSENFSNNSSMLDIDETKIDYNKKFLLYIGAMRKNKNLMRTIQAYEKYCSEYPQDELLFYIAGAKNGEFEDLNRYVLDHNLQDRVHFIGYVSDAEKEMLYKKAFASVLVSEYEGFGIPLVESMAAGTPVITSNCSSMKEIAEGYGILVDPMSIDDISEGIVKLQNKALYEKYVQKGYERASEYSWTHAAEQLQNICVKLDLDSK